MNFGGQFGIGGWISFSVRMRGQLEAERVMTAAELEAEGEIRKLQWWEPQRNWRLERVGSDAFLATKSSFQRSVLLVLKQCNGLSAVEPVLGTTKSKRKPLPGLVAGMEKRGIKSASTYCWKQCRFFFYSWSRAVAGYATSVPWGAEACNISI